MKKATNKKPNSFKADSKPCASCGRSFDFRKKWEKNWEQILYCSEECRKNKNRFDHRKAIIDLLHTRESGKTICPSEILVGDDKQNKELMEYVRRSARLLAAEGEIEITQSGKVVDPSSFKGPIRLRLKAKP